MTAQVAPGHSADEVSAYLAAGHWGDRAITDYVRAWAQQRPDAVAFGDEHDRLTWSEYDAESDRLAVELRGLGLTRGDRLAVLLPDSPALHVAWVAAEKAGLVVVGIGSRAGEREVSHLLDVAGAATILTGPVVGNQSSGAFVCSLKLKSSGRALRHLMIHDLSERPGRLVLDGVEVAAGAGPVELAAPIDKWRIGPSDLFMLNSTSGTTGLPKCVKHTLNRWIYFHQLAVDAARLTRGDVFCSAVSSPFGFGIWTAHVTPAVLGATTFVLRRFSAEALLRLLAAERVTVLAAVTTQFIMMLNSPVIEEVDLSALRVLFTGGEAVPVERAAEFERRTGARVLQFYGSNETGALSRTTVADDQRHRLTTSGRVITDMQVRLIGPETGRGQAACRGPATCEGYHNDPNANAQLYTSDGWMLTGDVVDIDADGYLTVIGRTSDIIIRGGKNISAPTVEAEVGTHPAVAMVAAVSMPDDTFGERVCVYVQPREGHTLTLGQIVEHLENRGVTREWFPERLVLIDRLPTASGGKIAKGELRADIRQRLADEAATTQPIQLRESR